jgi:hypothetical protein
VMEHAIPKEPRCILCDRGLALAAGIPAAQEDPDLVCWGCAVLSPADRKPFRGQAIAQIMRTRAA